MFGQEESGGHWRTGFNCWPNICQHHELPLSIDLRLRIRSVVPAVHLCVCVSCVCQSVSMYMWATEFAQLRPIDCSRAHKTKRWQV